MVALIQTAFVAGRNSLVYKDTSLGRITRPDLTGISLSSGTEISGLSDVTATVFSGMGGVDNARIIGTSVIVVTKSFVGSVTDNTGGLEVCNCISCITRVRGALIFGRKRDSDMLATFGRITGVGETLIAQLTSRRGISDYALIVTWFSSVDITTDSVALSLGSSTIRIGLASDFAWAQVSVNLVSSG